MGRTVSVGKSIVLAAAACALGAAPVGAQSNNAATAPPPTNSTDIGPGELSNFSLNGTVTRPADRPPATQPPPAAVRPEPAAPTGSADDRPAPATADPSARPGPNPADSDLFRRPPTLPDASAANEVSAAAPPMATDGPSAAAPPLSEGFSLLPWIVALFAAAGIGAIFFGRQRRAQRYAADGPAPIDITRREKPEPKPSPAATPRDAPATAGARRPLPTTLMPPPPTAAPVPPKPDPAVPGGIVATSLRPWMDIELTPDRALLDETGAAIAFEVTLFNSGSAAARDVTIEAKLLNAGANQDVELSAFFTATDAVPGDPIPQIAPYARVPLRSAVRLTRAEIREYEVEGRKLFMPLVAINIRYRWSSGKGQSAAGFLVGQGKAEQEKLAPLRLDRGARSWTGLGARRYEKGLRS